MSTQIDEALEALKNAVQFKQAGEFEKALERHEWFHANALKISETHYGTRQSYALKYWVELAEVYPPALDSLVAIRDATMEQQLEHLDRPEFFADVNAINGYLNEQSKTLSFFKQLDEENEGLAKTCFKFAVDEILAANEAELFLRYVDDARMFIAQEIVNHNRIMAHIADNAPNLDESIPHFDQQLANVAIQVMEILHGVGRNDEVREIHEEVSKLIKDSRLAVFEK